MSDERDEIRRELDAHLEMRAEQLREQGVANADEEARRRFGNKAKAYEATRQVHVREWVESVGQDLLYAWRSFRRTPGFTLAAVATMALGIGAATSVFSVVDRILFRPLAYAQEERLVWLGMLAPIAGDIEFALAPDYDDWRRKQTVFEEFTAMRGGFDCDLMLNEPLRVRCARVEWNFLPTVGLAARLGRNLNADDDRPGAPPVALISSGLWSRRFGGSATALGQKIDVDGQPVEVVGVLPAGFELPTMSNADILLTNQIDYSQQVRGTSTMILRAYARLKPGVSLAQAQAAFEPLFADALTYVPERFRKEVKFRMYSLRDRQVRDTRTAPLMLLGAVLAVFLIACANVANLLLARAAGRQREIAIRRAIGAGRARILRQMVTESLLLCFAGCALGLWLASGLLQLFVYLAPAGIPRLAEATLDGRVLGMSFAISLFAGLVFGAVPVLQGPRVSSPRRVWLRPALVAGQIAISVVLLTGAGLLTQSLYRMQSVPLGFAPDNLVAANITLSRGRYPERERRLEFFRSLERNLAGIPGVTGVALADSIPPAGGTFAMIYSNINVEGRAGGAREGTGGMVPHRFVTPGYFATMGIPILRGRGFNEDDRRQPDSVIVLGERLAKMLFGSDDPLEKVVRTGSRREVVIGVAADVRNEGIKTSISPEYYELHNAGGAWPANYSYVLLRAPADAGVSERLLRTEIQRLDSRISVEPEAVRQRVAKLTAQPKFQASLLSLFAALGVLLAAVGLYAGISYLVIQRTREIGVRMALGATKGDVAAMVLRQAGRWTVVGIALGVAGAIALSRFVETLLFGVPARDPVTLALVALLLAAVALVAAWVPARRAMAVDPMEAIRHE